VGTSVYAEWNFSPQAVNAKPDFQAINKEIFDALIDEFAGPADKGVYRWVVAAAVGNIYVLCYKGISSSSPPVVRIIKGLGDLTHVLVVSFLLLLLQCISASNSV